MSHYFSAGGMFMMPLTLLAVVIVILIIKEALSISKTGGDTGRSMRGIYLILQLGLLSFFLGILSQALGLMGALQIIEEVGGVSSSMLAGGLKVSMIASIYGLIILIVAFIGWMVLRYLNAR